jgi:transcriptional regulator with XRE-family HTH domain
MGNGMIEGQKLRARRQAAGVTQAQIADVLGLSKQSVSESERRIVGVEVAQEYLNAVETVVGQRNGRTPRTVRVFVGDVTVEIDGKRIEL